MKNLSSKTPILLKTINLISYKPMFSIARTVSPNWKSEILRKPWFFNPSHFHNVSEEQTSYRSQLCIFNRYSRKKNQITTVKEVCNIFSQNFKANILTCNKIIPSNSVAGLYSKLLSNINPFYMI